MDEYLNPWYIFAEKGTGIHVIMMLYGNGDKPNVGRVVLSYRFRITQLLSRLRLHFHLESVSLN